MLLSEFKEYLAYGELSQLHVGELLVDNEHFPRMISAINLGLLELYKRFPIKVVETVVQLVENTFTYTLGSDVALIKEIYDEEDNSLPLNDETSELSLFIINHNVIKHPYATGNSSITVVYYASPTKLALNATGTVNIDIPPTYVEALVNYVAYRTFAAINMNSAEAVNYYSKFEAACALLKNMGYCNKDNTANIRLENSGWI